MSRHYCLFTLSRLHSCVRAQFVYAYSATCLPSAPNRSEREPPSKRQKTESHCLDIGGSGLCLSLNVVTFKHARQKRLFCRQHENAVASHRADIRLAQQWHCCRVHLNHADENSHTHTHTPTQESIVRMLFALDVQFFQTTAQSRAEQRRNRAAVRKSQIDFLESLESVKCE